MYDHKVLPDMTGTRPDSTISLVRFDPVKEMDILRVSWSGRQFTTFSAACNAVRAHAYDIRGSTCRWDFITSLKGKKQGASHITVHDRQRDKSIGSAIGSRILGAAAMYGKCRTANALRRAVHMIPGEDSRSGERRSRRRGFTTCTTTRRAGEKRVKKKLI